jgi:hypothetical protein
LKFTDFSGHLGQLSLATRNGYYSPISTPGDVVLRSLTGDVILFAPSGSIRFATEPSVAPEPDGVIHEKMTILQNGNVGIGTTNPGSYKLAVEGRIGAREIVVTQVPWADKVFEDGYHLMPLNELEQHIKTENHLPGIPSETEVLEKGVSLGGMQAKLLEKIEGLTLYVIDQNKRIEKLEKENEELKNRVSSLEKLNRRYRSETIKNGVDAGFGYADSNTP